MTKRIGIYAGVFNPVHAGHIAFAVQALKAAKLDKIYFMPERKPRHKTNVEHFGHRVAMLKQAIKPHPKFEVLELVDVSFSVNSTLPKLKKHFANDQLVMLMGSDVVVSIPSWPNADRLLTNTELVVGLRSDDRAGSLIPIIDSWPVRPRSLTIFNSFAPDVSAGRVREALRYRRPVRGVLRSVEHYSNRHWLYVSLA